MTTVIVLAGGLSHERDVSLRSGRRVASALRDQGFTVVESDVTSALVDTLSGMDDVVVFPLLHGEAGEDGALREVLAVLEVPFVGSDAAASRIAFDKSIATPVVASHGIRTPQQFALPHEAFRELGAGALMDALATQIGFPMMVKPARSGSALGCSKVTDRADLPAAMVGAYSYGGVAVVQEFIDGPEVAVTVVDTGGGPQALPPVEIRPDSGVYDYASRYTAGMTEFVTPTTVSAEVEAKCMEMALACHELLHLRHLSRTDIMIRDSEPYFLETNVAPGMTETSLVPLAVEAAELDLGPVCAQLVRLAQPQ